MSGSSLEGWSQVGVRSQKERNECRAWRRVVRVAAAGGLCSDISLREIRSESPWSGHVMGQETTLPHLRLHLWTRTAPSPADARSPPHMPLPRLPSLFVSGAVPWSHGRGGHADYGRFPSARCSHQLQSVARLCDRRTDAVLCHPKQLQRPANESQSGSILRRSSQHARSFSSMSALTDMHIVCSAYTPRAGAAQRFG